MTMKIATVNISTAGGVVSVKVEARQFPQSISGVIWRYKSDKTSDGKAGVFNTQIPEVSLGAPSSIKDKFFLVEGGVLHQNDDIPTPYQVVVTITQGDKVVLEEIPPDGGTGQIENKNIPFWYRFEVKSS
jgi:hypothetical protein